MSSSAEVLVRDARRADVAAPPPAELKGATVRYGDVVAVDALDLTIEAGRVTVLLGPNGAGKTSSIRLLLGLARPATGTARVFGRDPRTLAARRRTGVMMQIAKVPETLRVSEHIDTFRSYFEAPLPRAELIEAAGLQGMERRLYGTLSGGERQRVLFALALAGDPALLFLDEPTVGMDVAARRSFWARIRALREGGRAVLLTTHYLDEADALADRVVVLDRGRIVADGSPAQIKRRIAHKRISFVSDLPDAVLDALPGVVTVSRDADRVVLLSSDPEATTRELLRLDARLSDLEIAGAALEDAFLALTGSTHAMEAT